jgi:HIV Tat-specific factor 1
MEQRHNREAAASAFPTNPEEFDSDDRISFSKLDNKFILVQEDGTEFEFDDAIKRWVSTVDEALLEEQQRAYMVSGVDESEPVEGLKKKRKKEYVNGEDVSRKTIPHNITKSPTGRRTSSKNP